MRPPLPERGSDRLVRKEIDTQRFRVAQPVWIRRKSSAADLLERSEGPLRPMAIAWELEVDKFQVSRALAKLTQAGVVEQVPPPPGEDGRSRWYSLTSPTGAARSVLAELADALGGMHPDFAEAMREILEDPAAEATYTSVLSKHLRRFIPGGTSSAAD